MNERIYLSPPHMSGNELTYIHEAFDANWVAPIGPQLTAFENALSSYVGVPHVLGLSSGTAAIHLALMHLGIGAGDEVIVSTLTFSGSVNPIYYVGATPVFIDSETRSWNMDPALLREALADRAKTNNLPKAVIIVHLYGQCADMDQIVQICAEYNVPLIEDAAEALGSTYHGRSAGAFGHVSILSFNGNKIITTSGGGALLSHDENLINHSRKLATQAREHMPHYEHQEIGYNYRLSNILAAIGLGQLEVLEQRIEKRRWIFDYYQQHLSQYPGIGFMPDAGWGRHTRWLTVITIDPKQFGADREAVRVQLETENIESRPLWKPMHMQPVFSSCSIYGGGVSEMLFRDGLCLPSGTALTEQDLERIVALIAKQHQPASHHQFTRG